LIKKKKKSLRRKRVQYQNTRLQKLGETKAKIKRDGGSRERKKKARNGKRYLLDGPTIALKRKQKGWGLALEKKKKEDVGRNIAVQRMEQQSFAQTNDASTSVVRGKRESGRIRILPAGGLCARKWRKLNRQKFCTRGWARAVGGEPIIAREGGNT